MPSPFPALAGLLTTLLCVAPASGSETDVTELLALVRSGFQPSASIVADALVEGGSREVSQWLREAPESARLARATLDELNRSTLRELLSRRAAAAGDDDLARAVAHAGLMLAGAVGTEEDLALVLTLGRVTEGADSVLWRSVRRELESALQGILARHPRSVRAAARLYAEQDWPGALSIVRAVAAVEDESTPELLAGLLGLHPRNDGSVLGEIGSTAESTGAGLSTGSLQRVRFYLEASAAFDRRQAAYALGRLDDDQSVPALLDLLTDDDGGVRRVSHWALQRITRMTMAQDEPRWRAWFEEESAWWAIRGRTVAATLRTGDTAAVLVPVINECASKRLFRRALAPELVPLLDHADPAVVRMTCSALLSLRAREAAPAIIELLEADEPEVRTLAWKVLRELTGQDLPATPAPWRTLLAAGPPRPR